MKKMYIILIALMFTTLSYASKSISIDLSKQRLYAKENGRVVFSGAISSGKSGLDTPRGTFRILEKDRFHVSNKYPEPKGGAKMPYMHRLTNGGIAIHQGYLPGYPASHGCIRVSKSTALKLWRWSRTGIRVSVYGSASNFRYVKRKTSKKKRYTKRKTIKKKVSKRRHYAKKHIKSRKITPRKSYSKKRYTKRRVSKRVRHYAKRSRSGYKIIEIYDSW